MISKKRITMICMTAALLLCVMALTLLVGCGSSKAEVFVQKVEDVNSLNLGSANRYSGLIETPPKTKVNFDSSNKLGELMVKEGDKVKKGDVLFTYDPESINIQIEQGELEIERLNSNIRNSNAQIAELTKDKRSASTEEVLGINAQIMELQADISQYEYDIKTKQSEIKKLKESAADISVKSPVSGTVDSVGDPEAFSMNDEEGYSDEKQDAFITIVESGEFRFKGRVSEQSVSELTEGTGVVLRSRVDDTQYWKGKVQSVDLNNAGEDDESNPDEDYYGGQSEEGNSATFYDFYVTLDSSEGLLLGQHVTCEIDYGQMEAKEGIALSSGWFVQDEEGNYYVWAASKAGGSLEKRKVTVKDYDEMLDIYTIEAGLEENEYIAWPDSECEEGAKTTTRKVTKEEDPENGEPGEEGESMEGEAMEGGDMEGMENFEEGEMAGAEDFEDEAMADTETIEGSEGAEDGGDN